MAGSKPPVEPMKYEIDNGVATLTFNRPERLNALSASLFDAWNAAIDRAIKENARALIITGEGRAFCAGADLQADDNQGEGLDRDLSVTIDAYYNPMIRRLSDLDIPVITAVNGPAVGAGMGFALAGDFVVAAQSSYFLLAFVNIGLVPDAGTTWLVSRALGRARTMELALLGERLEAVDALEMGLINRVVVDETVLLEARAVAAKLASGPSKAIGMIRKQVAFALDNELAEVLERERENQREAGFTEDFAEAVSAFAAKRTPAFQGR